VSFKNRRQELLSGVLHVPDPAVARGACVLLLSPGIKGRVGPHRLYLKIAACLVPQGFHVLRFDYFGLGDSEGTLPERVLAEVYNSIQDGRYVDDTVAAMDWMQATHGVRQFVASGLCGGSISGLLAAAADPRIASLLCLGIPVAFEGSHEHWGRYLTRGELDALRGSYLRKTLKPTAWLRFVTGQSNYRVILKTLRRVLESRRGGAPPPAEPLSQAAAEQARDNTNPKFAPSFLSFLESGRPAMLVFSGADRLGWEFEEKFAERHAARLVGLRGRYAVHTIESANHVLSDPAWVAEFLEVASRWLAVQYPISKSADQGVRS
jgi:pimeloyl-ACP methyl ester carboxylesterase